VKKSKMIFIFFILSCVEPAHTQSGQAEKISVEEAFAFGDPIKLHDWGNTPQVKICEEEGISIARVQKALSWWERLGYSFGDPIIDSEARACRDKNILWNGIIFTLPHTGYDYKYYALTETYRDTDKDELIMARIYIREDAVTKERVLEHEIGHALGWQHYSQKYHMMHPDWKEGGYSLKGLKAR